MVIFAATPRAGAGPGIGVETRRKPRLSLAERERLGDEIAELEAQVGAVIYEVLVRLRAFDREEGWHGGFRSCAHRLNWRTGLDLGAARERVRVARALERLPLLSEELRTGRISYSKVRAVTRIATPAQEEELRDSALNASAAPRDGGSFDLQQAITAMWRPPEQEVEVGAGAEG